jgi:tetratricopeptide (TPR) repeat protein
VVPVLDGARTLTVTATQGGARVSYFSLALVTRERVAALDQAEELRQAKPEEAKALLLPLLSDERTWVRASARGKLARIERDIDKQRTLFHEAMHLYHQAGWISEEVKDGVTLVNNLVRQRLFTEAQDVLARIAPLEAQFPEGRSLTLYYRAKLASSVGNLRAALRFFDAAREIADRLDYQGHLADVLQHEAEVLLTLGRSENAMARDHNGDTLTRQARPCQRAQYLDNAGWHAILAAESLEGVPADLPDPILKLREALTIYEGPCNQPGAKSNNLTNLAIASIEQGRVDAARDYLDQARQATGGKPDAEPNAETKAWWMIVEARIARATGQPDQELSLYEQIMELAARESLPDAMVRAALGRAQALESLGRVEAARKAYADADALLDGWSLLAPLGEGRETFLARYEASTRQRVEFLVRQAERERAPATWIEEAATAARRGRARILDSLQWLDRLDALSSSERARWEKTVADYRGRVDKLRAEAQNDSLLADDARKRAIEKQEVESKRLRDAFEEALAMPPHPAAGPSLPVPPAQGEVLLVSQPIQKGWVGFAVTHDRVVLHRIAEMDSHSPPEQIAARLLDAFSDVLENATSIRFAPHGRLSPVDFHKLRWRGQPLLDRFIITYGLDLSRARGAAVSDAPPLAILVANPSGDVPGTLRAARFVAGALEKSGWRVELIHGEAATHDAVREALERPGVQLFFYAGHGFYKRRDGLESGLRLAGHSGFTVVDVMALSRVPPQVVLSGCETAKADNDTPVEGLGLAQAFVLAGASAVVATARPVEDKLAEQMMRLLYHDEDGRVRLASRDLPAALREAQRAAAQDATADDWAAFRVLVP